MEMSYEQAFTVCSSWIALFSLIAIYMVREPAQIGVKMPEVRNSEGQVVP